MQFDVARLLSGLGIEPLGTDLGRVVALCPKHDDTGKPNWSIDLDSGLHHCWSCGYGGSLLSLIADRMDWHWPNGDPDLMRARRWARIYRSDDLTILATFEKPVVRKKATVAAEPEGIRESHLGFFTDVPAWALKARHLTVDAVDKHGVRWDGKNECWILPIRDPWTDYLRGWQVKGQRDRLFRNHPVGVEKSDTLFGPTAFTGGRAILVESPLDVLRLESIGISGGLATYGAAVSERQLDILIARVDTAIIAMDNPSIDAAGRTSSLNLRRLLTRRMQTWIFDYDHTTAKDIGDMTDAEINLGIFNARYSGFMDAVHE